MVNEVLSRNVRPASRRARELARADRELCDDLAVFASTGEGPGARIAEVLALQGEQV